MMRMVSATGRLVCRRRERRGRRGQRKREPDPGSGTAVRSIEDIEPTAVRLDEPPADEEPQAGARDSRLPDIPGPMERFRDETPFRLRHPDPLVIDGDGQPRSVDCGT